MKRWFFVAAAWGAGLVGCPGGASTTSSMEPCKRLGDQCQLEPGKLGACAYKASCEGANCLYCQSQH